MSSIIISTANLNRKRKAQIKSYTEGGGGGAETSGYPQTSPHRCSFFPRKDGEKGDPQTPAGVTMWKPYLSPPPRAERGLTGPL